MVYTCHGEGALVTFDEAMNHTMQEPPRTDGS